MPMSTERSPGLLRKSTFITEHEADLAISPLASPDASPAGRRLTTRPRSLSLALSSVLSESVLAAVLPPSTPAERLSRLSDWLVAALRSEEAVCDVLSPAVLAASDGAALAIAAADEDEYVSAPPSPRRGGATITRTPPHVRDALRMGRGARHGAMQGGRPGMNRVGRSIAAADAAAACAAAAKAEGAEVKADEIAISAEETAISCSAALPVRAERRAERRARGRRHAGRCLGHLRFRCR